MKKKLLGLGVCALALGVVAGAVSARGALEAKADGTKTVYLNGGGAGKWNNGNEWFAAFTWIPDVGSHWTKGVKVSGNVYSFEVPSADTKIIFARMDGSKDALDWDSKWDQTNDLNYEQGKNCYTITASADGIGTGSWGEYEPPEQVDAGIYLAGLGGWDLGHRVASDSLSQAEQETLLFKKMNLALTYGNKFKAVTVADNDWDWKNCWGSDDVIGGTGENHFTADGDKNVVLKGSEQSHPDDGNYNVYLTKEHKLILEGSADAAPASDGYYLLGDETFAGSGKGWIYAGGKKMSAPQEGDDKAVLMNVTVAKDAKVKVRSYISHKDTWYTAGKAVDDPEPYDFAEVDAQGNYVFTKAGAYNFFLNKDGELFIAKYQEPVADVYKALIGGEEIGTLSENPNTPGEYMIASTDLTAGDILSFTLNGNALSVAPKSGSGNNVTVENEKLVVRMTAEGVGLYLSKVESNWVVWVDGYLTPDHEAVDAFVATYITPYIDETWKGQTQEQRTKSCQDKYAAAHAAFIQLTQDQQDLFNANARYGAARTAYLTWEAVASQISAMSIASMKNNDNSGLIITLVAIGGAAVLGMGVYFASRKRKSK